MSGDTCRSGHVACIWTYKLKVVWTTQQFSWKRWWLCSKLHDVTFYMTSALITLQCLRTQYHSLFVFGGTVPPPPSGPWPPHSRGFYITHSDTPQPVGLLWTSDQLVAVDFYLHNTQYSKQTQFPPPKWDWKPKSQQAYALDRAVTGTGPVPSVKWCI